jgi:hypothetical protein
MADAADAGSLLASDEEDEAGASSPVSTVAADTGARLVPCVIGKGTGCASAIGAAKHAISQPRSNPLHDNLVVVLDRPTVLFMANHPFDFLVRDIN